MTLLLATVFFICFISCFSAVLQALFVKKTKTTKFYLRAKDLHQPEKLVEYLDHTWFGLFSSRQDLSCLIILLIISLRIRIT